MKRAAIYVRVSTEEQRKHGLSVDNQITALEEYCKANKYQIVNIYNDAGISARKKYTKRPALLQLITDCESQKVDIILFTKLDRWFRSVADYYQVQSHLDNCKVPWRAIWEDYETETSAGVFKVNIMLSVAQAESDRTGERIRATFDYKRAKGDYVGTVPYGYKSENNRLVIDPEKEPVIRLIFDVYIKTHSSSAVMKKLIDNNIILSRSTVAKIIRSDTYAGNAYGSDCEAYITPEQHARILEIRSQNYRTPANNHTYLFSNICYCGDCGGKLRSVAAKRKGVYYKNYFCTGTYNIAKHDTSLCMSEKKLEKYLLNELNSLIENYNIEIAAQDPKTIDYEKEKSKLENKLERIGIRFEEGDISAGEYKEKRKAILEQIASLTPEKKKQIELPPNWQDVYNSLDDSHKQSFWFSIIGKITLNSKGEIKIDFI